MIEAARVFNTDIDDILYDNGWLFNIYFANDDLYDNWHLLGMLPDHSMTLDNIPHSYLKETFYNWPANNIEEWVIDTHQKFKLRINQYYDIDTETVAYNIKCYGIPYCYDDYMDSLNQAHMLHKLESKND